MTSPSDEDHVTAGRVAAGEDGSCSPSSVTIVDLDTATDDRPPEDADPEEQGGPAGGWPTTLRVPTPSSWEKYRVVVPITSSSSSPQRHQSTAEEPTKADVKVIVVADLRNDLLKDDVDRRPVKKPCSCGAASTDSQVIAFSLCG